MGEVIAAHAVLGFEMADARLDDGAAAQVAFDRLCDAPFLAGDIDLELMLGRGVVAAVTAIGGGALCLLLWDARGPLRFMHLRRDRAACG